MTFSKEEAEKVKKHFHDETMKYFMAKDVKGLTSLYHPDAVLIHQGKWCAYGTDEISKKNEEIVNMTWDFDIKEVSTEATGDGKFVVHKSEFTGKQDPSKKGWFAQIYMKGEDGKYLIVHDIFSM
uniref:DUF4440 domain-containing protein n=1 Tax=Panagrolaimus sp. PS1159 TaxID=55785 RepID=A0AC35GD46_9BILA